jgi:T-complex protein 1 subunit theta
MLNFTRGEEKNMEKVRTLFLLSSPLHILIPSFRLPQIFKEIADSGVKVIVAGSSVGELAMHYLDRFSISVIKVLSKFDLRRLSRVVGATPLARLGAPTAEEAGKVDVLETIEIGGDRVTVFRQEDEGDGEKSKMATILLRGATSNVLDDMERAIDDGVNVIKALSKDGRMVPGAGATEIELARRIEKYGSGMRGLNQHAVKRFASALEVVPSQLADNAGLDAQEIVGRLYKRHDAEKEGTVWGVDIDVRLFSLFFSLFLLSYLLAALNGKQGETDGTLNTSTHKIYDSLAAKKWAIKLATEAATTVLRVDSIIMSKPAGGPKVPQQSGNWDED